MNREGETELRPDSQHEQLRETGLLGGARQIYRQAMRDDVMGLSAELSYRFFLALFPFVIFLTALGALITARLPIENPAEEAVRLLGDSLPPEAAVLLQGQLQNIIDQQSPGFLSIGALLAVLFATGGTNATIKALDRVYGVREHRPIWKRYPLAIAMTIVAGTGLVGAFLLIVPVRIFGAQIARALAMPEEASTVVTIAGGLLAFALLFLVAAWVYRVAPNIQLPLRSVLPGALLFAGAWIVGTVVFFIWVTTFADYAATYGALAGGVIVLLWLYFSALLFLLAGEFNEVLHEMRDPADVAQRRRTSELAQGRPPEKAAGHARARQPQPAGLRQWAEDDTDEPGANPA